MHQFQPGKKKMLEICKLGKYYEKAALRYGGKKSIICDRCFRKDLDKCVGYESYDLCLDCTKIIIDTNKNKNKKKNPKIKYKKKQPDITVNKINLPINDLIKPLAAMRVNIFNKENSDEDEELCKSYMNISLFSSDY